MSIELEALKQQAAKLSDGERAQLALFLIESLEDPADDEEFDKLWGPEIERRLGQIDRGEVRLIPGDEVFAELRAKLGSPTSDLSD
jgi:putative addiction module component (TIGR02574 family)